MKIRLTLLSILFIGMLSAASAQSNDAPKKTNDYQIHLKQPAKQIKLLMYDKNFLPIQGVLSEDRKSIIMKDYIRGSKVYVKVVYEDDTEEEFTRTPCFIDPVIL